MKFTNVHSARNIKSRVLRTANEHRLICNEEFQVGQSASGRSKKTTKLVSEFGKRNGRLRG